MTTENLFKWKFDRSRLLAIREANSLTQQQVADRLGKTKQMYQQWESGERTPNIHSLLKICAVYNVAPKYFFTESVYHNDNQVAV
jgi:transcriptional regulator with XRE-family HTH domain